MARETVVKASCDRCKKLIAEEAPGTAAADLYPDEKSAPTFYLEVRRIQSDPAIATKGESLRFDDLCTRCKGRVMDLVGQLRLDQKEGADAPDKQDTKDKVTTPVTETPPASLTEKPKKLEKPSETLDVGAKPKDNKSSNPASAKT